jgi:hypothetical protein
MVNSSEYKVIEDHENSFHRNFKQFKFEGVKKFI